MFRNTASQQEHRIKNTHLKCYKADDSNKLKEDESDHGYLQLSGRHFENQLHHGADGQTSRAGGVDLVPDGVTVHLQKTNTQVSASYSYLFILVCKNLQLYLPPHLHTAAVQT